jgi:hypothetical protein
MNASLVRTRRHWLHLLSTSLFLAIALMAFGVRPWTSLLSGFVVTLQSFLGLRLLQLMRLSSSKYLDELLGPGFVVGAAIWTIPIQLVSSSQSAAVIGCVLFTVLSLITFGMSAHETTDRLGSTCLIFGLTLIAMSSEWPSLVLPGLLLIGITKFAARVKKLMWLPALMATMLIPLAFSRSHDSWWLVSEELNYYEALRSHLLDFGIWESWGPTNLALYHWFSYAWGTQLSAVSFAGDFVGVDFRRQRNRCCSQTPSPLGICDAPTDEYGDPRTHTSLSCIESRLCISLRSTRICSFYFCVLDCA